MKALILDSGVLINFSMNGLLYLFEEFKEKFGIKILITEDVKYEIIDKPIGVPRFELGAMKIKELLDSRILEMPEDVGVKKKDIDLEKIRLMEIANHSINVNGKWMNIVGKAEMSCLALSSELNKKEIENIIGVDERTTRILGEKPKNFEEIISKKLNQNIKLEKENLNVFSKFRFVRSSELVYVAYKKNILGIRNPKALEAALYATKYKGASISFEEIEELKKL